MKKFLLQFLCIYLLPVAIYTVFVYLADPLKCFKPYKEYYKNSFVSPNRENVALQLFEQSHNRAVINSFILGNSCSHAFKVKNWEKYLPERSRGFHLDAFRETIYGILKKLEYLDRNGNKIEHVLIVLDESIFSKKFKSYMYVIPQQLDPENSTFYTEHLKVLTSVKFVSAYAYYSIYRKNTGFTAEYKFTENQPVSDNSNGDLYYTLDNEIKSDSVAFFERLQKENWVKRINLIDLNGNDSYEGITKQNILYLNRIKEILKKHKTDFKIIINPLYNQKGMPIEMLSILEKIFEKQNIYNFSGVNAITNDYRNFYDGIHYRPLVATQMLENIYQNKPFN
jgi:hypothetical protein